MKPLAIYLCLCSLLAAQLSMAADTTYHRKPMFMSISAGYTSSHASGSMVDMLKSFNQEFGIRNAYQKNGGGISVAVLLQKQFSRFVFYKTGLSYVQKRVYPKENSYPLYKDSLNTGYISIPFLFGVSQPLNKGRSIWLSIEGGPIGDVAIVDNTYKAPDREGYNTLPFVLGVCGGAGISFGMQNGARLQLQYNYSVDITNAVNETLYWGAPNEMYRTRSYKYDVQSFSLGVQWPLGKVAP